MRSEERRFTIYGLCALALLPLTASGQKAGHPSSKPAKQVEFELMTWPELQHAIHDQGRGTVLIYNGGTEQRGPQAVTGGHTFIARNLGREIAERLGNAILAPVLPYSVNNADADLPGTIGITGEMFEAINRRIAEQLIVDGFKNVVLMGDHGGGQQELADLAKALNKMYAPRGVRVVFCGDVYQKAGDDFNRWLRSNGYPVGEHASVSDTSEMLYLEGDRNWVRQDLLPSAVGALPSDPDEMEELSQSRVGNGISGDARRSTAAIGKVFCDIKVKYAVAQIRRLLSPPASK